MTGRRLALAATCALALSCAPPRPRGLPPARDGGARLAPGGLLRDGSSWLRPEGPGGGILLGRLEGSSYRLGLSAGRLGRARIAAQERHLDRLLEALIPSDTKRFLLREGIALQIRHLDRHIPDEILRELVGIADGYEPETPKGEWPAYRRLLGMHAIHDISQRWVDAPALASACTGFVAGGRASRDGHVLLARNFDFEGGEIFDRGKVVWVAAPEGRIPYLSVGFPGMLGVMSGFNREGIGISINAVSGGETAASGEPMTLLLLDVLENERTLEGAIERIRKARVFVSDLILVADAKSRTAAIVEKAPGAFAVRRMDASGLLAAANEPRSPEVRARTLKLPPGSTSRLRLARLEELLRTRRPLDVPASVAILRDRSGTGGVPLGPGNRNAIDGMIAAHAVVFDLTARRAWVAVAPHTLGAFVPVDLEAVLADAGGRARASSAAPLAADPFLVSGGWDRYRAARRELFAAGPLLHAGDLAGALPRLERAHALSPDFAEATGRLGAVCARLGMRGRALALLREALARDPAPAPLRTGLEAILAAVEKGTPVPPPSVLPEVLEPDEMLARAEAAAR